MKLYNTLTKNVEDFVKSMMREVNVPLLVSSKV